MGRKPTGERYDLIVVGGGMTGLALATAVGGAGYRVLVVERASLTQLTAAPHDGRVTAVARGGRRFLEEIGAWTGMADAAAPILDIVVREAFSPIEVHYDHRSVGAEPLGHIVENRAIRCALIELAQSLPTVTLEAPAEIEALERPEARVDVRLARKAAPRLGRRALLPRRTICASADDRRSVLDRLGVGRYPERQRARPG